MRTIDLNFYLKNVLSKICWFWEKNWSEVNNISKMFLKSSFDVGRIVRDFWFSVRSLKENDEFLKNFRETVFWLENDRIAFENRRNTLKVRNSTTKKKKKRNSSKNSLKNKYSDVEIRSDATSREIFAFLMERKISAARASKLLGGIKLDFMKIFSAQKNRSPKITIEQILDVKEFLFDKSTVEWIRRLKSTFFAPCIKQLFLRKIYQLTGIVDRKRSTNIVNSGNLGAVKTVDLQAPAAFWKAFEDIHQIQFDNEASPENEKWNEVFQQFIRKNRLDHQKVRSVLFEFRTLDRVNSCALNSKNKRTETSILKRIHRQPKPCWIILSSCSSVGESFERF